MALFEEGVGRKFVGLIILFVFLLGGVILCARLIVKGEEWYAKYVWGCVVAYGVFVTGNTSITGLSILKNGGSKNDSKTKNRG